MQMVFNLCVFIDLTPLELKRQRLKFVTDLIGYVIKLHGW